MEELFQEYEERDLEDFCQALKQFKRTEDLSEIFRLILINNLEVLNLLLVKCLASDSVVDLHFLSGISFFDPIKLRILYVWASNQGVFIFPLKFFFTQRKYQNNFVNSFNSKMMVLIEEMLNDTDGSNVDVNDSD